MVSVGQELDVCGICEELKVKIRTENNRDIRKRLDLKLHKTKAGALYAHLREATERARNSEEHETVCFDFQQNLPFPHLPVREIFYKRQLWFYNFGVNSCKTGKPVMYIIYMARINSQKGLQGSGVMLPPLHPD